MLSHQGGAKPGCPLEALSLFPCPSAFRDDTLSPPHLLRGKAGPLGGAWLQKPLAGGQCPILSSQGDRTVVTARGGALSSHPFWRWIPLGTRRSGLLALWWPSGPVAARRWPLAPQAPLGLIAWWGFEGHRPGLHKASFGLSPVIESKLIFTKQSPKERGGHGKPGGRGPEAALPAFNSARRAGALSGNRIHSYEGGGLSRSSPASLKVFVPEHQREWREPLNTLLPSRAPSPGCSTPGPRPGGEGATTQSFPPPLRAKG